MKRHLHDGLILIVGAILFYAVVYDAGRQPPEPPPVVRKAGW